MSVSSGSPPVSVPTSKPETPPLTPTLTQQVDQQPTVPSTGRPIPTVVQKLTIIELHTKQPVELRSEGKPGEALNFHGVLQTLSQRIREENKDVLGSDGFILAGVERDNLDRIVMLIGWDNSSLPSDHKGPTIDALEDILVLLASEPIVRDVELNGTLKSFREDPEIVLHLVKWNFPSTGIVVDDINKHLRAVVHYLKEGDAASQVATEPILGRHSLGNFPVHKLAGTKYLLMRWGDIKSAKTREFVALLMRCEEHLEDRGVKCYESLFRCYRYWPA